MRSFMAISGWKGALWSAVAGAGLVLAAGPAQAQRDIVGPVTVHPYSASLRGAFQDENSQGLDRIGRGSANHKQIAEQCLDRSLSRSERVVLATDCAEDSELFEVYVLVVDTDEEPAGIVAWIGGGGFEERARKENRDQETTDAEYSVWGNLGCEGMGGVQFSGYAKGKRRRIDPSVETSPICLHSANARALGQGFLRDEQVVLEKMSFGAGGESKRIELDAQDLEDFLNQ
jgi:hypothetical protein